MSEVPLYSLGSGGHDIIEAMIQAGPRAWNRHGARGYLEPVQGLLENQDTHRHYEGPMLLGIALL